jgi:DNA-directed RNA polymerase specialized sigma24 family protein
MGIKSASGFYRGLFIMDDNTLIVRWRRGDSQAFGDLYVKYNARLKRYIEYLDPTCPEDTAHDIWIKVNSRLDKYQGGNFSGWLFRMAYGTVIDRIRTRPKDIKWLPEFTSEEDISDKIDYNILSERQREVVLFRLKGLEYKEISRITGIPIGTLQPAYTTAVMKLRKDLIDRGIIEKRASMDLDSRYIFKGR